MKSIMISIKPEWCSLIMNKDKTIEVRKNKALANAIQKLIDENGYADIYVYCSKENDLFKSWIRAGYYTTCSTADAIYYNGKGKVVFKFRCYKVEEIVDYGYHYSNKQEIESRSCLDWVDLKSYLKGKNGYAIYISDLEIFDEPKELLEFKTYKTYNIGDMYNCRLSLTKAPQNYMYVEVENGKD